MESKLQFNTTQHQTQHYSVARETRALQFDFNQELPIEKKEKADKQKIEQQKARKKVFTKQAFIERFEIRKIDPKNEQDARDMWFIIVHNRARSPFCNKEGNEFIMQQKFESRIGQIESNQVQDEEAIKSFILLNNKFFLENTQKITGDNNPNGKIGLYFLYDKETQQNIGYTGFEPLEYKDGKISHCELQVHILDGKFTQQGVGSQLSAYYRDNILLGKTNGEYNTTLEFDAGATYQRRTLKSNNPSLKYQNKIFPWAETQEEDGNCIKTSGSMSTMIKYAKYQKGDIFGGCADSIRECTANRCEIF